MNMNYIAWLVAFFVSLTSVFGSIHAADNERINLRFLDRSDISRSSGCSVSLWQSKRDPDKDKFAFVFFEKLVGPRQKRAPAVIKIGRRLIKLQRVATGGKKGGYDIYPYQLYKFAGRRAFVVLDLRVEEPEGEAVEISGGNLSVSILGKKVFSLSVKGGAGCMTPAAAAPDAIPNSDSNVRSARRGPFGRYPVCTNPRDPIQKHVCKDNYLISLNV